MKVVGRFRYSPSLNSQFPILNLQIKPMTPNVSYIVFENSKKINGLGFSVLVYDSRFFFQFL